MVDGLFRCPFRRRLPEILPTQNPTSPTQISPNANPPATKTTISRRPTTHLPPSPPLPLAQTLLLPQAELRLIFPWRSFPRCIARSGMRKRAKLYIRKIRHETIWLSVIQRLEEYLNINQPVLANVDEVTVVANSDDEDEDGETRPASPEPFEIGMWHDRYKYLFLWYYDIYVVYSPSPPPLLRRLIGQEMTN